jgi:oligopeptidase B
VLAHLREENAHAERRTAHLEQLRKQLYTEHLSHIKETDDAAPVIRGDFFYYTRTLKGKPYKLHCRKPRGTGGGDGPRLPAGPTTEQLLLDENTVAEGRSHCDIHSVTPSPDGLLLAYTVDFEGNEVYSVVVLDLATGEPLAGTAAGGQLPQKVASTLCWGADNVSLFYLKQDATLRPYQLWVHMLPSKTGGASGSVGTDTLLFEERDEQFWLGLGKSLSGRFIFADSASTETSEIHALDLHQVGASAPAMEMVQPRRFGLRYEVEHDGGDGFIILTNKDRALNNRLMSCSTAKGQTGEEHWAELIPYDPARNIAEVVCFSSFLALAGREDGLTQLWLLERDGAGGSVVPSSLRRVTFDEELYEVDIGTNLVFDSPYLRYRYSSLTTPARDLDLDTRVPAQDGSDSRDTLIKEAAILNFDRMLYVCKRIHATASDKAQIPMSIVYRKDLYGSEELPPAEDPGCTPAPTPKPLHLYGYGSYGVCIDPAFDKSILPYLDRGMIFVIANIRGGGEMGRHWYEEQGKYLQKRNTFSDFVACAEQLIDRGYTTPAMMSCEGRSAGGLLMGNVLNMRPDLFQVAVCGVPFVDLMVTMCDPSIPLTTNEW